MTSLNEKADDGGGIEVVLASDAGGVYRLQDDQLTSADNVTEPGEFPEYGDFAAVNRIRAAEGEWLDADDAWLECPQRLAEALVQQHIEPGDVFAIAEPQKTAGGRWSFTVSVPDSVDDLL